MIYESPNGRWGIVVFGAVRARVDHYQAGCLRHCQLWELFDAARYLQQSSHADHCARAHRFRSMTAAALQVARPQSAVSRQLKKLEDSLGKPRSSASQGN